MRTSSNETISRNDANRDAAMDAREAAEWQWQFNYHDYIPRRLDDGQAPEFRFGLRVSTFVGEGGEPGYAWQWDGAGDANPFEIVGLLERLKMDVLSGHAAASMNDRGLARVAGR